MDIKQRVIVLLVVTAGCYGFGASALALRRSWDRFTSLTFMSIEISLGNEHDGFVVLTRPIAREPSCPAVVG